MKLDVAVNEVVLSNVGTTGEFRIRNSAKAFAILSSGLYSNKIKAIIRELSCNAVDSHVGAGKAEVPFEVHLPTFLEPWFSVKDFGLGLDGDQVVNIYTTYFESTKTDSNAFIGALGLGSKSPFSYTENFTVTAIKNGIRRIYSAFINEVGVPSIAEMSEELTDEGNGVEVKFSVTDRYDYNSFRNEAHNVFYWFEHKPTITGDNAFEHRGVKYKEQNVVPGVHVRSDSERECIAIMGNIAYPLNNVPEAEKHFGELSSLLDCGLVLEFGIGDLDFAASREQLSYIPLTINSIRTKLEQLNANLAAHLATKADAIVDEWDRAEFLYTEHRTRLYASAVKKYVIDTKFPLFDPASYHGKKDFTFQLPDLESRKLDMKAFHVRGDRSSKIGESSTYINNTHVRTMLIPVDKNVVIVLNDLKTGCVARARYHFSSDSRYYDKMVYCVSHTDTDLAVRQAEYNKIIQELHKPPVVLKASELSIKERTKPLSTNGIAIADLKSNGRRGYADSYTWSPYSQEIDENETYYYVCLCNHESIDVNGKPFNIFKIKSLMDECGVKEIENIKIFGVRKNRIKEIQKLDNWIWIEDILKEETAKVADSHIASLVASEMLDAYYNRVYTNTTVAKQVGPDSAYAKYVKEVGSIKRASGNVTQLVQLCDMYCKKVQVEAVKKRIQDAKDEMYTKYPLMKYFKDASDKATEKDAIEYIKMVDKQEKTNE